MDFATQQAFVPKVLTKIIQNQDNVTWTSDALHRDARFLWWAGWLRFFFWGIICLGVLAILFLIGWRLFFRAAEQSEVDAASTVLRNPMITSTGGSGSGRVPGCHEPPRGNC
jgi:hypothetical protein